MDQRPKAKRKRESLKSTDEEQSEQFKQTARKLGVDESGESFERAFKKLVPPKRRSKST
jgi:hypothetical protein